MLRDYIAISSLPFAEKNIEEFINFVKECNIGCVEIVLEMYDEDDLIKLKEEDFKVLAHAPWYDVNIGHLNDDIRNCSIKVLKKSIKTCYKIGCEILTVHSGRVSSLHYNKRFEIIRKTIESLKELVNYAKNYGISICLENAANIIDSTCIKFDEYCYVLDNVKDLYITLDIGHAITSNDIEKYLNILNDYRLKNIHLHDNDGKYDEHLAVGDGIAKNYINNIVDAFKKKNFYITIEVSKIEYINKSIKFLENYI